MDFLPEAPLLWFWKGVDSAIMAGDEYWYLADVPGRAMAMGGVVIRRRVCPVLMGGGRKTGRFPGVVGVEGAAPHLLC